MKRSPPPRAGRAALHFGFYWFLGKNYLSSIKKKNKLAQGAEAQRNYLANDRVKLYTTKSRYLLLLVV